MGHYTACDLDVFAALQLDSGRNFKVVAQF